MLHEQVEKREKEGYGGEVTTVTGICKFCGQAAARKALGEWDTEEINELVTETCECLDARIYAHKKGQKERANASIDLLFGKDNKSVAIPDAAADLLRKAVYPVCEGFIKSVTVDIGNGVKGKIGITPKGIVKVERNKTDIRTYEA